MATEAVLDLERLLAPIAGGNPAGVNFRADRSPVSPYQLIKGERNQVRMAEREALQAEDGEAPRVDWKPVYEQGRKILAEQSKDFEVAAWLTEAVVRQHGFPGLRDAFRLARGLVEQYWETMYPAIAPEDGDDGVVHRVAAWAGLNGVEGDGTLIPAINTVPLTEGRSAGPFSRADYLQAEALEDPKRRAQPLPAGAVTLQMFEQSAAETSPEFFRETLQLLQQCTAEYTALCDALEQRCGAAGDGTPLTPPSSNIRTALGECERILRSIAGAALEDQAAGPTGANGEQSQGVGRDGGAQRSGRIQTRDEAFQELLRVAQFFKGTEPHSPVSYALEQAVRWGRMPLPDLLKELIADDGTRDRVYERIGIMRAAAPPSG